MSIRDLSKDDILHAIGLETRKSLFDYLVPVLGIFSAGLLVGAGLGVLFAPKRGSDLRTQLRGKVDGVAGRMRRQRVNAESDMSQPSM